MLKWSYEATELDFGEGGQSLEYDDIQVLHHEMMRNSLLRCRSNLMGEVRI